MNEDMKPVAVGVTETGGRMSHPKGRAATALSIVSVWTVGPMLSNCYLFQENLGICFR